VAEGIFDVFAVFNATSEYVLYYHSGRKTIRYIKKCGNQREAKKVTSHVVFFSHFHYLAIMHTYRKNNCK
jgi:DNA topoisomerase IB